MLVLDEMIRGVYQVNPIVRKALTSTFSRAERLIRLVAYTGRLGTFSSCVPNYNYAAYIGRTIYPLDDYRATLEIENASLAAVSMSRDELVDAFIEYDIARSGLATLAQGQAHRAK